MMRAGDHEPEPFTEDGLERLLERAERDPAASEELDFLADLVAAAELERARLARPTDGGLPSLLLQRQWLWAVAASALFVGVMALWFLRGRHEPARALAEHAAPRYVESDLRAGEAPRDDAFPRAMERYSAGDYAGAAEALAAWLASHPKHGPARFYLAACREQLGELERAARDYRAVAEEQPGFLGQHARWRLANLELARDDVAAARAELARLQESPNSFTANAVALLRHLDGR